jgi:hypothetical protein
MIAEVCYLLHLPIPLQCYLFLTNRPSQEVLSVPRKDFVSLLFHVQNLNKKRNSIGSEREKEETARKGETEERKGGGGE